MFAVKHFQHSLEVDALNFFCTVSKTAVERTDDISRTSLSVSSELVSSRSITERKQVSDMFVWS